MQTIPSFQRRLARFVSLPIRIRELFSPHLSPAQRASIWREHFQEFLGVDSHLTTEQQKILRAVYDSLPGLYRLEKADMLLLVEKPDGFLPAIKAQFDTALYRQVFMELGGNTRSVKARFAEAGLFAGADAILAKMRSFAGLEDSQWCNCTVEGSPLRPGCNGPRGQCDYLTCEVINCGTFFDCDGMCGIAME